MITALLVDDEDAANRRMRTLLAAHPKIHVLGAVENVAGAEEFLAHQRPDVMFLVFCRRND
jgi:DNA-binding LytR/AlgR family response regulator